MAILPGFEPPIGNAIEAEDGFIIVSSLLGVANDESNLIKTE